jgi:hypothetical protein
MWELFARLEDWPVVIAQLTERLVAFESGSV